MPAVIGLLRAQSRQQRALSRAVVAEGRNQKSNGLLGERVQRGRSLRLAVGQLLSTFQLGLHDAVFGRQVFVPRQQLLVRRAHHVG